jgi:hypothetical protein
VGFYKDKDTERHNSQPSHRLCRVCGTRHIITLRGHRVWLMEWPTFSRPRIHRISERGVELAFAYWTIEVWR